MIVLAICNIILFLIIIVYSSFYKYLYKAYKELWNTYEHLFDEYNKEVDKHIKDIIQWKEYLEKYDDSVKEFVNGTDTKE